MSMPMYQLAGRQVQSTAGTPTVALAELHPISPWLVTTLRFPCTCNAAARS